ncbi:MAG: tyrosine-protein phosphatase [Acidobacteria bacterium]|nr:tyrosine-protein phosphatase [Acidobacteriota bacterium]
MNKNYLRRLSLLGITISFSLLLIAGVIAAGRDSAIESPAGPAGGIKNFGQVNDFLYRGGQPEGSDYRELSKMGIKTILDLRADSEPDEKSMAEKAGLRYLQLPLEPKSYPPADAAAKFLAIVNDKTNWPVFVHCNGGRHRTGVMIAVYRMTNEKWTVEQAYEEMKKFDFYTRFGHGSYKDYVYDYYRDLQKRGATNKGARTSSSRRQLQSLNFPLKY